MPLFGPPDVEKLKAKGNTQGLIKALRYQKDEGVRQAAAKVLGQVGDTQAVLHPLIAALKDEDRDVREAAARALGQIRDTRAVEPLAAALKDNYFNVQLVAAEALGMIGDARAVSPLVTAALLVIPRATKEQYEWCTNIRKTATTALKKIGDALAIELLVAALKDEDSNVRAAAVAALDALAWQPVDDAQRALQAVARQDWETLVSLGAAAAELLVATLKDRRYDVREAAAEALVKIGHGAMEPLLAALKDSDVRAAAVETLIKIGTDAVEPLVAALKNEDSDVRVAAVEALGKMGDARAVQPLVAVLKDLNSDVYEAAVEALVKIGNVAVEPLVAALKDENDRVRLRATEILGKIGDARAVEPLVAALKDSDSDVYEAAVEALVKIGNVAVEPLAAALKDEGSAVRKKAAAEAIKTLDWQPINDSQRAFQAVALQEWRKAVELGTAAVEPLVAALKDEDSNVRKAAAEALDALGWQPVDDAQRALQAVACQDWETSVSLGAAAAELLVATLKDRRYDVREAAAEALGKIGNVAVEPLVAALKDRRYDVREAAAEALGKIGNARAIEPLMEMLKDYYTSVREAAAKALEALDWQPIDNTQRALYAVARRQWDVAAAIGVPAIEPLVMMIKGSVVEAGEALESILKQRTMDVAVNDLQTILQLGDITRLVKTRKDNPYPDILPDEYEYRTVTDFSCSEIRQLARQELIRRGLEA